MKTAIGIGGAASGKKDDFEETVGFAVEAEKLGVNQAWSAEAWGYDAVSTLAYIGARTKMMTLGTGIMQISARTPSMTAMTALTMSTITGGRFILGLGASGPQVVEGLQGQSFAKPLVRMRETIEIVRQAFRGEKLNYQGEHHILPRPGGEGKALRLSQPPNANLPIWLATLSPRALELTGELADGWLGTSFTPDAAQAHLQHLRRGAEKAGRSLSDITLCVGASVAFTSDPGPLIEKAKPRMAFQLGAMGSAKTNFYNDAYKRSGFEEAATLVQKLWVEGRREEATAEVPDDMIASTSLFGDDAFIRDRVRLYQKVGIDVLRLDPVGATAAERLETLGRAVEIVREEANSVS
ncbi:MAG TPA: LLM class flavin-dependent oxidoreductase [Myxococcales bacterium]|nr:LLM class flavin-dependent oxidoreductase [Myxococcales bacterium]HIK85924.1 LLM class flavin-dependent oxidoreductase [Myxococcales bacterium]